MLTGAYTGNGFLQRGGEVGHSLRRTRCTNAAKHMDVRERPVTRRTVCRARAGLARKRRPAALWNTQVSPAVERVATVGSVMGSRQAQDPDIHTPR